VLVHKTLTGQATLDASAVAGKVQLSGSVDISARVTMHLIFGVDSGGFFVDPISTLSPALTIDTIALEGDVQGDGQFGFAGVSVGDGTTLTVDPAVALTLTLAEPAADPVTGTLDDRIRLTQLSPAIASVQAQGGNNNADVVFTPTFNIAPVGDTPAFNLGG